MPLLFKKNISHEGVMGLWKIQESEKELLSKLTLSDFEKIFLASIKGEGRRKEWLAVRLLLHVLSGRPKRMELKKDDYGKPYLSETKKYISISHSHEMAAVVAADVPCGIDIQYPVRKIRRLVPKYCNDQELQCIDSDEDLDTMHVIWGAKEAMYKAYGKRKIDYRKDMNLINPYLLFSQSGLGTLNSGHATFFYEILAEKIHESVIQQDRNLINKMTLDRCESKREGEAQEDLDLCYYILTYCFQINSI